MENNPPKKFDRNTIIAIIVLLAIILISIIGAIISNLNSDTSEEDLSNLPHHDDIVEPSEPYAYFQNSTYLKSYLENNVSNSVFNVLSDFIVSGAELVAAPSQNSPSGELPNNAYVVTFNNSRLVTDVYFPYSTYKFTATVSDGRTYRISLATNGSMCYGLIIERTTPTATSAPYFYIGVLELDNSGQSSHDQIISSLTTWARSLGYNELILTTND